MTVDGNAGSLTENLIACIEAAGGVRPSSKGLQELYQALAVALAAFNPGIAVGTIEPGAHITVDATDPTHPIVAAVDFLESLVEGNGISIDTTDPLNPTISTTGGGGAVDSVTGSTSITVDNTDPANPIIERAAITGDAGIPANSNTLTFEDVNTDVGTFGDDTHVAAVTVNAKGLVTAVTEVPITGGGSGVESVTGTTGQVDVDNGDPANPVISLPDVGPGAGGPFGNATHVAAITIDDQGRITEVTEVAITGGSGGIDSVVAGTNVTIDDTDPANPIVNAQGVLESVVPGTNVTVDNTDPANPIINANAGSSGITVASFDFDSTQQATLVNGVDTGIAIPAGSILRNAYISTSIAWDGFSPFANVGISQNGSLFGSLFGEADLTQYAGDGRGQPFSGEPGASSTVDLFQGNGYIVTEDADIWLSVAQNIANPSSASGDVAATLPLTITPGTNDQFVFTPSATGIPEVFTVPGGTYITYQQVVNAMLAATGAVSGELFSTKCNVYSLNSAGGVLVAYALVVGTVHDGDTISPGVNDASVDLGFTENPNTFSGGADPFPAPGSTVGESTLTITYTTP